MTVLRSGQHPGVRRRCISWRSLLRLRLFLCEELIVVLLYAVLGSNMLLVILLQYKVKLFF